MNTSIQSPVRYGITESKKAQLDQFSDEIVEAEFKVEQNQAVVSALTEKLDKFQTYFNQADQSRSIALNNRNSVDAIVQHAKDLRNISSTTQSDTQEAQKTIKGLAESVRKVVDMLIYTAESVNKLSNLILRKKAKNPLLSDELIAVVGTVGAETNNAVALSLNALQSTLATQSAIMEAHAAATLESSLSMNLFELLSGTDYQGNASSAQAHCLAVLIDDAYERSEKIYEKYKNAVSLTSAQLSEAKSKLASSEAKLESLQAAFGAANAAAIAG